MLPNSFNCYPNKWMKSGYPVKSVCLYVNVGLGGMLTITPRSFAGSLIGNAAVSTAGCRLQGRECVSERWRFQNWKSATCSSTKRFQHAVNHHPFYTEILTLPSQLTNFL